MYRMALVVALILAGCAPSVPTPTVSTPVESVPPAGSADPDALSCIYMITDLQENPGQFAAYTFDFMVWAIRGKNIDGLAGAMYSESVQQWLTLDGSRAAGTQEAFPEGTEPVIYLIEGSGDTMVATGWTRVDQEAITRYSAGYLGDGSVAGC